MPMNHLHLTISPVFFNHFQDYLLDEENLSEFFNRIGAICFNDYCTFYYSPQQQKDLLQFLNDIDDLGHETNFLRLLDSENVEEADDSIGGLMFQYLGFGALTPLQQNEAAIAIYEKENIALIDFTDKKELSTIQVILDLKNKLQSPKEWTILSSYLAFLDWSTQLNPRTFDEQMDIKHPTDGKKGFGSSLLCSKEEAKNVLQYAFYKKSDHENHLFFYHLSKDNHPILWLKANHSTSHFHGFHISEETARAKGLKVSDLQMYSNYFKSLGLT
jgi:hypothetical protein